MKSKQSCARYIYQNFILTIFCDESSYNVFTLPVADPEFSPGGAPTPKSAIIFQNFAENCIKMKEFGPPGGERPWHPLGSANAYF